MADAGLRCAGREVRVAREYCAEGEYGPESLRQSYDYATDQSGSVRRVFASATNAPARVHAQ
ncbi:MAG: hypothetical protein KGL12_09545 [Rhodospirillales bacterium]|nr:hypothetical protein [Rhodospirillales bacterium]